MNLFFFFSFINVSSGSSNIHYGPWKQESYLFIEITTGKWINRRPQCYLLAEREDERYANTIRASKFKFKVVSVCERELRAREEHTWDDQGYGVKDMEKKGRHLYETMGKVDQGK